MTKKETTAGYLFILPAVLGFLLFSAGPMLVSLYYSFTRYSVMDPAPAWVGLKNYAAILTDPLNLFPKSLSVTLTYAVGNILTVLVFSLLVAVLLNRRIPGKALLRAVYFMPSVLPTVSSVVLWGWIMEPSFGILNVVLDTVGLPRLQWLNDESTAIPSLLLMGLWFSGGSIVVYLASLQDVPAELVEAVRIDGGNAVHSFRHVVLPMISPVIFFQTVIGVVGSLQAFIQSVVLTREGAPNHSMYFLNVLIYDDAFRNMKMGLASAEAWALFLIILALTGLLFRSSRLWVHQQGGGTRDGR
jgi:multiple sugar transport system permease protein